MQHTLKLRKTEPERKERAERERDGGETLLRGRDSIHSNGCNRVLKRCCQRSIQSSYWEGVELLCLHRLFIRCLNSCSPFASPLLHPMVLSCIITYSNPFFLLCKPLFFLPFSLFIWLVVHLWRSRGLPPLKVSLMFRIFLLGVIG